MTDDDRTEIDKLCEASSPKMGRPKVWTDEVIRKWADELIEYSEDKTSLTLGSFATKRRYCPDIIAFVAAKNEYFARALITAKRNIGERREKGALLKKFEPKTYSMTARMYDVDLDRHQNEKLYRDTYTEAKAKLDALKGQSEELKIILRDLVN